MLGAFDLPTASEVDAEKVELVVVQHLVAIERHVLARGHRNDLARKGGFPHPSVPDQREICSVRHEREICILNLLSATSKATRIW
jgi:hypothetical protein